MADVKVGAKPGQAAHTAAPAGSYADPGYQADGKKRYPLDTPEHVRAALSYIGKSGNAAKYSASQLASMKARMYRAAKAHGIDAYSAVAKTASDNQNK